MSWRPKDWKNPHQEDGWDCGNPDMGKLAYKQFEAGADAMLEVLRKDGLQLPTMSKVEVFIDGKKHCLAYQKSKTNCLLLTPDSGCLVFVPNQQKRGSKKHA